MDGSLDFCSQDKLDFYNQATRASLAAQSVKNLPAVQETRVRFLGWEDPWRRKWQPTPVIFPGKSHGQRSLVCCSPWGHKESGMTEQLTLLTYLLTYLILTANVRSWF